MGRKRIKKEDEWMPLRVYRGHCAYELQPKSGGKIRLCSLEASKSVVLKRFEEENFNLQHMYSVKKLFDAFFDSTQFQQYQPRTQKDYYSYSKDLLSAFGKMDANSVTTKDVRQFIDVKSKKSGVVQANRHLSALKALYSWGCGFSKVDHNPCSAVKKNKEKPRERYITEQEYQALLKYSCPVVYAAAQIAYLCMARIGDILALRISEIQEQGLCIKQGKTKLKQIKAWGPMLRLAIKEAKKMNPNIYSLFIIFQENGNRYSKSGFRSRFLDAKEKARCATNLKMDFTFHDIKAKGISDFRGSLEEKREAAGHTTNEQTRTYVRTVPIVNTVETSYFDDKDK